MIGWLIIGVIILMAFSRRHKLSYSTNGCFSGRKINKKGRFLIGEIDLFKLNSTFVSQIHMNDIYSFMANFFCDDCCSLQLGIAFFHLSPYSILDVIVASKLSNTKKASTRFLITVIQALCLNRSKDLQLS